MSHEKSLALLPEFRGKRTLKMLLRTLHLIGISGVCGSIFFDVNNDLSTYFWQAAIISGIAMLLIDSLSNLIWFVQVRGLVIMTKLGLLAMIAFAPEWDLAIILAVMILSGVISHAPSQWRYYSLRHGKVVKSRRDIKG